MKPKKREQEAWAIVDPEGYIIFIPLLSSTDKHCKRAFVRAYLTTSTWGIFKARGYTCQKITMRVK